MKFFDIIRENTDYKVSYSAVVLDSGSRARILNHLAIPNDWKVICHHMTIKMGGITRKFKRKDWSHSYTTGN